MLGALALDCCEKSSGGAGLHAESGSNGTSVSAEEGSSVPLATVLVLLTKTMTEKNVSTKQFPRTKNYQKLNE